MQDTVATSYDPDCQTECVDDRDQPQSEHLHPVLADGYWRCPTCGAHAATPPTAPAEAGAICLSCPATGTEPCLPGCPSGDDSFGDD